MRASLIQGLSTGIQGEMDRRPAGQMAAGRVLRLAARPVFLAGREGLLVELDARLTGDDGPGPQVVALCGLGGAGKTSVAVEYAHRHLADAGVAWQFAAEDPAVLAAGFSELAAALGAREGAGDPVASVHGLLAAYPARVAAGVRQRAGPGPGRGVLAPRWAWAGADHQPEPVLAAGQALDVPVLDPEVAAEFLVTRTGDPDRKAALDLAGGLGGLPLALEQAAAYIQATGNNLTGYLDSFRQRRPEMLARGEPTGYRSTVAATWSLAFGRLEQSAPGAAGLLRLLACCAPEAVPLRLLLQPREGLANRLGQDVAPVLVPLLEDQLATGDAIAALRRYSLISPPADGSVSVHGLVQVVTFNQIPAEHRRQWRQAAAALIEAAIPADTKSPSTWPVCATLLPHAQKALADHSVGMARIASYLGHSGSHAAARNLQSKIAEACARVHGPEHPDTLTARHELAHWTGRAGDPAGARDQFADLLPSPRAGLRCRAPGYPDRPRRPRPLDRGGWGPDRGPRPVRGSAAHPRAGLRCRAPGYPDRPRRPRPVDRAGR